MSRMRQAFEESWQREMEVMTKIERATVRACLDQVIAGMAEAREVESWWKALGPVTRQNYRDGEALVALLRRDLGADAKR